MPKKLLILNAELMHYPYAFTSLIWSVMAFVGSAGKDSFSFFFLMCFVLVSSFSLYTYSGYFFTSYFCFKNFSFYCQIEKLPFSPCSFLLKIVWVFLGGLWCLCSKIEGQDLHIILVWGINVKVFLFLFMYSGMSKENSITNTKPILFAVGLEHLDSEN